jgi:Holliday junction resolvase RusA-like endonuclease
MVISSAEVLQYEKDFQRQVLGVWKNNFNPDARLDVSIQWFTDSYRQDIDAPAKAIFDNLQKCEVIKNDNKIDEYYIVRGIDKNNPRVIINIEEI